MLQAIHTLHGVGNIIAFSLAFGDAERDGRIFSARLCHPVRCAMPDVAIVRQGHHGSWAMSRKTPACQCVR